MLINFFKNFSYEFVDQGNFLRYILRHCQGRGWQRGSSPGNSMWANGLHGVLCLHLGNSTIASPRHIRLIAFLLLGLK
jgi:hypothetical protein